MKSRGLLASCAAFGAVILGGPPLAHWAVTPGWRVLSTGPARDLHGRPWAHSYVLAAPVAPLERLWPRGVRYPFRRPPPPEPCPPLPSDPFISESTTEPGRVGFYWNDPGPVRHAPCPPDVLHVPGTLCP